jgi:hypothetical protein
MRLSPAPPKVLPNSARRRGANNRRLQGKAKNVTIAAQHGHQTWRKRNNS